MTEQTLTVQISPMPGAYPGYRLTLKASSGQETSFANLTAVDLLVLKAHIEAVLR